MKTKWNIAIGLCSLLTILFFVFPHPLWKAIFVPPLIFDQLPRWKYREPRSAPNSVDDILDRMEFGAIAFNAPSSMNIDDSVDIRLILSLVESMEELQESITEEGEKIGAVIKVSDRMEARLSGHMFQITAITPEVQAVSKSNRTEWKWEVHAKKEGRHRLHLTLTALIEIDGKSTQRAIRTFDRIIEVEISPTQRVKHFFIEYWQWVWAAVLIPIAGWFWKRKKRQQTDAFD